MMAMMVKWEYGLDDDDDDDRTLVDVYNIFLYGKLWKVYLYI